MTKDEEEGGNTVLRKIVKANFITFRTESFQALDCSRFNSGWLSSAPT
jgi:hypothetical protein